MVFSRSGNVPDRPANARAKNTSPESDLARCTSLYTNNTPVARFYTIFYILSYCTLASWAVACELPPDFSFHAVTCLTYSFVLVRCN